MKTLSGKSLVAASCGFAFALFTQSPNAARAQTAAATPQQSAQQQEGAVQSNPNDPVSLLGQLNLSQEQIGQMRSIQGESVPQARELTRRLNQARRALDEAIYSDAVEESLIEQRARDVADAQAALVRLRAQTELRVRRVLTPEQLQRFRDLRQQVRREQRIERQLDRGVNPNNPNRVNPNNPNRTNQRPNAPADQTPNPRTLQRLRERRRNALGRP
jgi:Spy/CpxP family protein refolding chaperone